MFFDYADHGSYAEETLRANRADLERIRLRQRVLVDVSQRDLGTTIVGEHVPLPLALAPIGLCGMQWGDGEILACKQPRQQASRSVSPPCRSARSKTSRRGRQPSGSKLNVMKDRGFAVRSRDGRRAK